MDVNTLHFKSTRVGRVIHFIHLDFRLELEGPPRKSRSRLNERFLLSRLLDLLCFRFDLSRSFARLRRTGVKLLLLLLERIGKTSIEKLNVC